MSPKAVKRRCFGQKFRRRRQCFEKQAKKGNFNIFLEHFDKKNAFFGKTNPPPPPPLVYIGAKGAVRKILGNKEGHFGSAGGRIPDEEGVPPPYIHPCLYFSPIIKIGIKDGFEQSTN